MTGVDFFNAVLDASALLFGVFGLALVFIARGIKNWPKGLSVAILTSTIVRSLLELMDHAVANVGATSVLLSVFRNVEVVVAQLPELLMFAYFLYCCGEDHRKSTVMRLEVALASAVIASVSMAQLTGEISTAPDGQAHLGPWVILFLSFDLAMSVVCLAALLRRWKRLPGAQRVMFLAMFLIFFLPTSSIGIVFVELLLVGDLVSRYLAQEEEAARQQARLAVLKMRPHFIHNTLTSIYYLCATDPKAAQQTILDFSRYLQNNFNAIVEEDSVPFTEELEHTRAYLAVEEACHRDQLLVEFDTPVTLFRIPPLTLQPIVENAVKHGLDPDFAPLRVTVSTRATETGVEVSVADNGCGYTMPRDGKTGFALDNIRERLKAQCDGTLEIESRNGDGTLVTISIPCNEAVGITS